MHIEQSIVLTEVFDDLQNVPCQRSVVETQISRKHGFSPENT